MIRPEDTHFIKIMETFEALSLREEELEKIGDYLSGEGSETFLQEFMFQDLEQLDPKSIKAFRELSQFLEKRDMAEENRKVRQILFAIGKSTGGALLTEDTWRHLGVFRWQAQEKLSYDLEPAQWAAVYAQYHGNEWGSSRGMYALMNLAQENPENLREALAYHRGKCENGKIFLLAAYFLAKYPEEVPQELPQEDALLLELYEKLLIEGIGDVFVHAQGASGKQLTTSDIQQLQEAVQQELLTDEILKQVEGAVIRRECKAFLYGFSYINYMFSYKIKNVVTLLAAVDYEEAIEALKFTDERKLLEKEAGNYDTVFRIPTRKLIAWAAKEGSDNYKYSYRPETPDIVPKSILRVQLVKSRQIYLDYQQQASFDESKRMLEIMQEIEPELYKEVMEKGKDNQKEKVIQDILSYYHQKKEVKAYLQGETTADTLYTIQDSLRADSRYGGTNIWTVLKLFYQNYKDEEFITKCMVFMAVCGKGWFFREVIYGDGNGFDTEKATDIFKRLEAGELDISHQFYAYMSMDAELKGENKKKLEAVAKPIFLKYLKECPQELKEAFAEAGTFGKCFALAVMEQEADTYKAEILSYSKDSAKAVKETLTELLKKQTGWQKEVAELLTSKKAIERELATQVMKHWNMDVEVETPGKSVGTEKKAKGKGSKSRTLAWAYETPFSEVHNKNGELADETYLQDILLCYANMEKPGLNEEAKHLAESLQETEFAVYANELFDKWLEAGADTKKRWVMYAASIHGGRAIMKTLYQQIQEWSKHSRGAIATAAVQALALNPSSEALVLVDNIAHKFKYRQVKEAAENTLKVVAEQLGLTKEELEDKIVPDFGFNEKGERTFDYGDRYFTVILTPSFELQVVDAEGKKIKSLPAPGKKDDAEKAKKASEELKEIKKQLKTVIANQKLRLELALSSERCWNISVWKELFTKNPIMNQFAIGLVWGLYKERKLIQSFRYLGDGTFNTETGEEYPMPEQGSIGLVHPIELSEESRRVWKQQLADYEMVQPIEQLDRAFFYRTQEEDSAKTLERFGGMLVENLTLNSKLLQQGWYRGPVQESGKIHLYYREDSSIGLGAELHFSGTYVVGVQSDEVIVYDARFYKAGTIERRSYSEDEADDEKQIPLKEIPERYFSEIVLQLTNATATSTGWNRNWKRR